MPRDDLKEPMTYPIPLSALASHTAFLGKTGAGKTTSAKGAIEAICRQDPGARVCILDPAKSDWWGITSSSDGRHAGLPFVILGGPRGHVPLHASAGAAIGELVASGQLPLSIIDMADFGPGGVQQFFCDFAPAIFKKMRGVLHLVLEEGHEFAPKERAGFGEENMTVYWTKKLATGGRSKGIRLLVATQRVQALHNAVLGSCETMAAHRITLPADQKPVKDWLKAHLDKPTFERVAGSLATLKTGTAWLCSGEAQVAELVQFPRLTTFDNSATPDGSATVDVSTAPVDQARLRAIIGDAVKEAEANDPKALKARIAELERQAAGKAASMPGEEALRLEYERGRDDGARAQHPESHRVGWIEGMEAASKAAGALLYPGAPHAKPLMRAGEMAPTPQTGAQHRQEPYSPPPAATVKTPERGPGSGPHAASFRQASNPAGGGAVALGKAERLVLTVLAQRQPDAVEIGRVAAIAGYSAGTGHFSNVLGGLRTKGYLEPGQPLRITRAGLGALGPFDPLPTGRELLQHWMGRLGKAERAVLEALSSAGGELTRSDVATAAGYSEDTGHFSNVLGHLRTLGLIEGSRNIKLHEDLR